MQGIEIVHSGDDYFSRLNKLILGAKKEIHLQTYIFENDDTGKYIANALKQAASRNVKIYLLLDGYGAGSLPTDVISELVNAGICFRFFSPLFSFNNLYLGRHLHHKIFVADGVTAVVGGINIADKYRGSQNVLPWLDYAVQVNGEPALSLQELCRHIFHKKKSERMLKIPFKFSYGNTEAVNILRNDWLKLKSEIRSAYIKNTRGAKKEIIILGSYFLPGKIYLRALKKASKRNQVKVKLILTKNADVPFIQRATRHLYGSLLNHNIEIYEWDKSVLHGKVAVADGRWATIGSFNLNHLSAYASIELNVEIYSVQFAGRLTEELENVIAQCHLVTGDEFKKQGFLSKTQDVLSYYILRAASIMVTYLPYKRAFKYFIHEE